MALFDEVQEAPEQHNTAVTSLTATLPSGSTAGNTLIARLSGCASNPFTYSMPAGWVHCVTVGVAGGSNDPTASIHYYPNCPAGITSVLATQSGTGDMTFSLEEREGHLEADQVAGVHSDAGSTTGSTGTTATTTAANELLLSIIANAQTNTQSSPTNSFALNRKIGPTANATGTLKVHAYMYDRTVSGTGAYGHDATISSTGRPWAGAIATFKQVVAGAGAPFPYAGGGYYG